MSRIRSETARCFAANLLPVLLGLALILNSAHARATEVIEGADLFTGAKKTFSFHTAKMGTVVVFLSANCPCSASHEAVLKELEEKNPDFQFIGVHANADETLDLARTHFKESALPFPILQDDGAKLANELRALKTPHVFLFNSTGEKLYEGGVTDTHVAAQAKVHFLGDAIEDMKAGRKPRLAFGRTLGCVIMRN